jgi:hypothetical protein
MASSIFYSNNWSRSVLAKNWWLCTQMASAGKFACGYVIHSTSEFSKTPLKNLRIYSTHVLAKAYPLTLCMP